MTLIAIAHKSVYEAGFLARKTGKTGAACPYNNRSGYSQRRLRKTWLDGWFAADKELQS